LNRNDRFLVELLFTHIYLFICISIILLTSLNYQLNQSKTDQNTKGTSSISKCVKRDCHTNFAIIFHHDLQDKQIQN